MDYNKILTNQVIKKINDSVEAAIFEGNKTVAIASDRFISLFSDTLTPEEYKKLDWEEAENFLFDYADKKLKKELKGVSK